MNNYIRNSGGRCGTLASLCVFENFPGNPDAQWGLATDLEALFLSVVLMTSIEIEAAPQLWNLRVSGSFRSAFKS